MGPGNEAQGAARIFGLMQRTIKHKRAMYMLGKQMNIQMGNNRKKKNRVLHVQSGTLAGWKELNPSSEKNSEVTRRCRSTAELRTEGMAITVSKAILAAATSLSNIRMWCVVNWRVIHTSRQSGCRAS